MGSPQFVLSQSPSHTFGKRREFSISKKGEISYFVHVHLMLIARGTFIGSKFIHILSVLRHKWIYQTSIFNSPSSFLESDSKIKEPYIVCCGKEKPFAGSTLTCKLLQGYKTSVKNYLLDKQSLTHKPFNSQKWSTCRFSLEYPYIIQQTGSENTQT